MIHSASVTSFIALTLLVLSVSVADAAVIGKPVNNIGLVGYWSFNEGSGAVAGDSSGNKNSGTLVSSPAHIDGIMSKSLNFDSTNYVNIPNSSNINPRTAITISAWINADDWANNYRVLQKGAADSQYRLLQEGAPFVFDLAGVTNGRLEVTTPSAGVWHHVVGTYNGSTITMYIDGVSVGSQAASGLIDTTTDDLTIATKSGVAPSGDHFLGKIDEVRIYNRSLTAAEVTALYNNRSGTAVTVSSSALSGGSNLRNGLVGHWTLDGSDITTSIIDRSGNGNNGGFFGGATSSAKVAGKLGQALNFDGVNDYIQTPINQAFSSATFAGWVKLTTASPTDFASPIFNRTGGQATGISINSLREIRYTWDNSIETWGTSTEMYIPYGQWAYMAVTVTPTTETTYMYTEAGGLQSTVNVPASGHAPVTLDDLRLGTDTCCGGRYWQGPLDDLRVYNRALSRTEIQQLIKMGEQKLNSSVSKLQNSSTLASGLVGHWTFDNLDMSDKVYDKSGQGNHGYLGLGATSTVKAAGKLGQGVNFRGMGNYVDVGNNASLKFTTGPFSVASWVYATSTATQMFLFHGLGCSNFSSWFLSIGGSENLNYPGKYAFGFNTSDNGGTMVMAHTAANAFTNRWVHLVGTYNGSSLLSLYVDGVLADTDAVSGNPYNNSNHLYLGADSGCGRRFPVNGLDDVRVYNRELSASDAKQLYNLGR